MTTRSKRVLWLLNHTTLMKTEVPIIRALGYEVFIPKILPSEAGFRSGSVDYSYDKHLSLPSHVLAALNATDFNSGDWSSDIVRFVNEYFGTVFVMMMPVPIENSLKKFKGALMLRAFGLDSTQTYADVLRHFSRDCLNRIHAVRHRFWFASGYEQLSEVEPKLIADRDIFLPLAMPAEFSVYRNTWTGVDKQIVFVCPNIKIDTYYGKVYDDFKRDFGDLPHVIVGTQKIPVDDPHVLGFVSDNELIDLLQRSAVMYYHSHEPRHLHYSPIEGAEVGTPVIFYRDNLLSRMIGHPISGSANTIEEAREKVVAILEGNLDLLEAVRREQQIAIELFSESHCLSKWRESFAKSGLGAYLETLGQNQVNARVDEIKAFEDVPKELLQYAENAPLPENSLDDGIDFSQTLWPPFVEDVQGVGASESWGAWSEGNVVEITLLTPLSGRFNLVIVGGSHGDNTHTPFLIEVGDNRGWGQFPTVPWEPTTTRISFSIFEPVHSIKIYIPFPTHMPDSGHAIRIGLVKIWTESLAV